MAVMFWYECSDSIHSSESHISPWKINFAEFFYWKTIKNTQNRKRERETVSDDVSRALHSRNIAIANAASDGSGEEGEERILKIKYEKVSRKISRNILKS